MIFQQIAGQAPSVEGRWTLCRAVVSVIGG